MLVYVAKRLLIMIPTFFGVSFMIWLVMTLAPGEPGGDQMRGSFGADATQDLENRERENLSQRMFREQFALNRPRFWNDWATLDAEEVRAELAVVREGIRAHGSGRVKEAQRQLEDWGNFAVPALMDLLERTTGEEQDAVLRYLKLCAYQFKTVYEKDHVPTEAEVERDRQIQRDNDALKARNLSWRRGASQEERAAAVAGWKQWYAQQQATGRWSYRDSFWERLGIAVGDTQFLRYWSNLVQGKWGLSFKTKEPVLGIIVSKLKYSLSLAVPAFIIAWILAVFLGVTSAAKHNSAVDQGIGVGLFMLYSIPSFLMATVVQAALAVELGWFPTSLFESPGAETLNTWDRFMDVLEHLVLPLFCYTYGAVAFISRQARSGMLEVMQSDYIRTARAKGVKEGVVLWKHALRNGMMPLITLLGTALPVLLAGSVVIEWIFQIPGFGRLMIDSIFNKDYNVVMGISLISAMLTLVGLLIADILYAAVDPRVSYE